ncbi:MAG: hypothetical protein M3Y71_16120 [Actinomycetota bacterium]|nr:hypothetical protein [Actinomycetota bacterium]
MMHAFGDAARRPATKTRHGKLTMAAPGAWMLVKHGLAVAGVGLFFVLLRALLLPEDR